MAAKIALAVSAYVSNILLITMARFQALTNNVLDAELEGKGKDPWGNQRISFSAKAFVNREDYGLKWNQVLEAGGVLVSTKIDIELEVQAIQAK